MESEFPGNSISAKAQKEPKQEKVVEAIIAEGRVTRRKKPLGKRFSETFFSGESARSILGGVFRDILVPAAQDLIVEGGVETLERAVHGSTRTSGRGRTVSRRAVNEFGKRVVNYSSASTGESTRAERRAELSHRARQQHKFDEIVFETRVEALEVLEGLRDLVSQYECATVRDFYTIIREESSYTDENWGWTNLDDADVMRARRGGYVIDLPLPEHLDK